MIFKDILWSKLEAAHKHLERIRIKRDVGREDFLQDLDRQESILFNLQMAIQNCIDLGALAPASGLCFPPKKESAILFLNSR